MTLPLAILAFVAGLVLLEREADLFTDKVGEAAKRSGVSETVIGLLTAGIEWEELFVVLVAVISGNIGIAIGDIIGSNIANLGGSFSLGLLVKPVEIRRDDRIYAWVMVAVTVLVSGLLLRGEMGRVAGGFLVLLFLLYVVILLLTLRRGLLRIRFMREADEATGEGQGVVRQMLWAFVGLALIVLGAAVVIESSVFFARLLGVSEFVIGLTVVAFGTTLPDKVISVAGAWKGRSGIVTANAIGSNIFNLLFPLGVAALVRPLTIDRTTRTFDVPFLLGLSLLTALLFIRPRLSRPSGTLLLALYAFYLYANYAWK